MTRSRVRTAVAAGLLLGATALAAGWLRAPVRMPPAPEPAPSPAATPTSRAKGGLESRVESLLARMTPAEKVGQLQQLDGEVDGRYRPEHLELARAGRLGSTLNVRGAANVNALQEAALASRLAIPRAAAVLDVRGSQGRRERYGAHPYLRRLQPQLPVHRRDPPSGPRGRGPRVVRHGLPRDRPGRRLKA